MTLKELIQKFDWNQISSRFFEIYPPYNEKVCSVFEPVWKELNRLLPLSKESNMTIFIGPRKYGTDVFGRNGTMNEHTGKLETFALEFEPWEEWLGMQISKRALKKFPELDIVCICISEMTTLGLDQETIKEQMAEIERRVADIKSGKAKLLTHEEFKKRLQDK